MNLRVVPNPTQGYMQIMLERDLVDARLEVMDSRGRVVHQASGVHSRDRKIPVRLSSTLPQGVYLVQVSSDTFRGTTKVVLGE